MSGLKGGFVASDPRLGRLPDFDERSCEYPVTALLTTRQLQVPRSYTWAVGQWLNQGVEGACVGFSVSHELAARPAPVTGLSDQFARELYWDAQRIDPWEGGAYPGATPVYEGSSVLAGLKAATAKGYYSGYRWAFSEEDLFSAIGYRGPAVLGVNWHEGMFTPDAKGFIRPTGPIRGGHAILAHGVSLTEGGFYKLWNSWGPTWGQSGTAKISRTDMATLLHAGGEAAIPTRKTR